MSSYDESNGSIVNPSFNSKYTSQRVFTVQQETMLLNYIIRCPEMNYGLTYDKFDSLLVIIQSCRIGRITSLPRFMKTTSYCNIKKIRVCQEPKHLTN